MARLLQTLEEVEAVERVDGTRWRIGHGVASLAGTASPERSLVTVARPHLARLVTEVGEDAGVSLPDGYDVHYVDQVESDNPVQVRDWTGTRAPMHAVPSGLVLLAEWPEDALAAYVEHGLARLTPRTLADARAMRRRLAEARSDGLVITYGYRAATWGFAAYIPPGRVAAIRRHPSVARVSPVIPLTLAAAQPAPEP